MKSGKSMKISEIRCKVLEDKKPAWNRAKLSIRVAGRNLRALPGFETSVPDIHENQKKNLETIKSMKIFRNRENV